MNHQLQNNHQINNLLITLKNKKNWGCSKKETSEFFIFSLIYVLLMSFMLSLLLITHKSIPEDDELAEERNEPGELP